MAGALKKTMIYLGLADSEEYEEQERVPAAPAREAERPVEESRRVVAEPEPAAPAVAVPKEEDSRPGVSGASSSVSHVGSTAAPAAQERDEPVRETRPASDDEGYRAPVTPIKRAAASSAEGASVRSLSTVHPRSYNDAKAIGEAFRAGMPVIMNVTELGENEAKRLVDFAAGLVFGLNGSISRITSKVFLLTPATVEVVGADGADAEAGALYDAD